MRATRTRRDRAVPSAAAVAVEPSAQSGPRAARHFRDDTERDGLFYPNIQQHGRVSPSCDTGSKLEDYGRTCSVDAGNGFAPSVMRLIE
ncbi:hypothetical protein F2P81_025265 [Scophthalmus maximus]|uniref:Uncharacterized protein n=1 Tax=Scophthalmus maximus TaxID=52904 RepID=A0A6A4RTV3_SCOMX|nr:hypothetical protein F2P81_025265 [Scophthalmus maximus]